MASLQLPGVMLPDPVALEDIQWYKSILRTKGK
jgi:hypothetical protein